jgi:hypothetical protein
MFSSDKIAPLELVATKFTSAFDQALRRAEPEAAQINE